MRISWFPLSLLAISCLSGCSDDGTGTSATTSVTSVTTMDSTTDATDGPDTGDGDGDTGDGDGDGDPGDGDGYCAHQCMSDDDCLVGGLNLDLTCVDSTCTGESSGCTGDEECVALYSGWTTPCTSGGGECDQLAQICIDVGLCATPPSDIIDCATLTMEEIQTTDIDGNPVTVCGQPTAVCGEDDYCLLPCASDDDCDGAYPSCDVGTGFCQCGSDADCATLGEPHLSVCNNGSCGCNDDQQCVDGNAGDVCTTDGFCGCSGDMACAGLENPFDGGMYACVQ